MDPLYKLKVLFVNVFFFLQKNLKFTRLLKRKRLLIIKLQFHSKNV